MRTSSVLLPAARIPRLQLVGGIIFSAVIPYLMRLVSYEEWNSIFLHTQTFGLVVASIVFGFILYRSFSTYPGVERTGYILSSFLISFGVVALLMILLRINYARFMFFVGFALSIVWFYITSLSKTRLSQFQVGVASFCDMGLLPETRGLTWVLIADPENPPSQIDAVAVDLRVDMPDVWEHALADFALRGTPVFHIKHLKESLTGQVDLEHISENTFGSLSPVSAYMTVKHLTDQLVAIVALVVVAVPLVLIGVLIRLDTPGPALFRQTRIGYRGRPFTVYKLRTMATRTVGETDARLDAMTRPGDTRVTRLGAFLRKTRLDELPQLINVALGQMSLIGPRPEAEILSKWYEAEIPFYRYRHIVRPGITGWAQVNQGHVAELDEVKTKLNFDFYYIKNFSPSLDLLIVARTLRTMVTGSGAR